MREHSRRLRTQMFTLAGQVRSRRPTRRKPCCAIETLLAARLDGPNHAPRSEKPRPQDEPRRGGRARAQFRFEPLLPAVGAPKFTQSSTSPILILQAGERRARIGAAGCVEGLRELARAERGGSVAFAAIRRGQLQVPAELTGQKEIQARWKRCVKLADHELGEALGQDTSK